MSITKTEDIFAGKILSLQKSIFKSESLKNKEILRIACPNWVNIIPVTINKEIIFVRQFRYGANENTLEIPGGMVDSGESIRTAAQRELIEETGYNAEDIVKIGELSPNPALFTNRVITYLAKNIDIKRYNNHVSSEIIKLELISYDQVAHLIKKGEINHALVIAALHLYQLSDHFVNT